MNRYEETYRSRMDQRTDRLGDDALKWSDGPDVLP